MIGSEPKQFKIDDQGHIFWQSNPTNPLPGVLVAQVKKGAALLEPEVILAQEGTLPEGVSSEDALKSCQEWMVQHIQTVLEPLFKLIAEPAEDENVTDVLKSIAQDVHNAMGIVPREQLEDRLGDLDADSRRVIRRRGVRLGPLLVFMPLLNKPAAVRLRALLWWLWNDRELPAPVPNDGIVSQVVDSEGVDKEFHQVIGYPVYGPKSIRIDMIDRVLNEVYEQADKGVFKAQHKMAEWLGCSITDLYAVLEAMGHKKVYDPADETEPVEQKAEENKVEDKPESPAPTEGVIVAEAVSEDVQCEDVAETKVEVKPAEQAKPELATFRLKKGKAHSQGKPFKPKFKKDGQKSESHEGKKFRKPKGKKPAPRDNKPRVITAEPKKKENAFEDSPFAILQQLKGGE